MHRTAALISALALPLALDGCGSEAASLPTEPVAYAEALLVAWAAQDPDHVAALAVEEVELATTTWLAGTGYEHQRDQAVGDGLHAVWLEHPGAGHVVVMLDTTALGAEDAVVGLDLDAGFPTEAPERPDNALTAYGDAFLEALLAHDQDTLGELATPAVAAVAQEHDPATYGERALPAGFFSFQGEPLGLRFVYPDAAPEAFLAQYAQLLELDPAAAVAGEDHAVTRLTITADDRWV